MASAFSDSDTCSTARPLLSVRALTVSYRMRGAQHSCVPNAPQALTDVSVDLMPRARLGILGESGCGKSTLLLSVANLLRSEALSQGAVLFAGRNLLAESERFLQTIRGARIGTVVQEAGSALNPVRSIGKQVMQVLRAHAKVSRSESREKAFAALQRVGLGERAIFNAWPHQLSGGQRQRVLIAQALICGPMLMLADEPTHALDHRTREGIVELFQSMTLDSLPLDSGMALLIASHDPPVLQSLTNRLAVLYSGQIVESGPTAEVLAHPLHPYTRALVDCFQTQRPDTGDHSWEMRTIPGSASPALEGGKGCRFATRCLHRRPACTEEQPALLPVNSTREVRCFLHQS